jgi:hypothetical protein
MKDQLKDKKVKCRICSGEHFTARCPFKDTMAPVEEGTAAAPGVEAEEDAGGLGAGKSSYVPPHMRKGGAGGGEKMGGRFEKDDLATLRVTNVCSAIFLLSTGSTVIRVVYFGSVLTFSNRSASWQRRTSCGISSSVSVVSPESSLHGIGKPREPRALLSSAMRTVATQHLLARRWMAVCLQYPVSCFSFYHFLKY